MSSKPARDTQRNSVSKQQNKQPNQPNKRTRMFSI